MRFIKNAAGIVASAIPMMLIVTGSVASAGDGANWLPMIPPSSSTVAGPHVASAWLMLNMGMLRDLI
jgi:hypothetical protein